MASLKSRKLSSRTWTIIVKADQNMEKNILDPSGIPLEMNRSFHHFRSIHLNIFIDVYMLENCLKTDTLS